MGAVVHSTRSWRNTWQRLASRTHTGKAPCSKAPARSRSTRPDSVSSTSPGRRAPRTPDGRTSPEELIAAAHSTLLQHGAVQRSGRRGTRAEALDTKAEVDFVPGTGITEIRLTVRARSPGLTNEQFVAAAEDAKVNCPVSQALRRVRRSRSTPPSPSDSHRSSLTVVAGRSPAGGARRGQGAGRGSRPSAAAAGSRSRRRRSGP